MAETGKLRIAILLPDLGGGGVERVRLLLAEEFIARGYAVDFVLMRKEGALLDEVPAQARVVELKAARVVSVVPLFREYLRTERPDAVLSALWPLSVAAALAARRAWFGGRVVVSEHADFRTVHWISGFNKLLLRTAGRRMYARADAVVAVSQGVREGLLSVPRLPAEKVHVIYNPVRQRRSLEVAEADRNLVEWWAGGDLAVVAAGALKFEKDFATLIRAVAIARRTKDIRLLILGEGPDRAMLEQLATKLGVDGAVRLPGFRADPYPFYSRAGVFVLSSNREGAGNVIVEALACGTPVVATDCRSGPRELLDSGRLGTLVAVGDPHALAEAVVATVSSSHDPEPGRAWAAQFSAGAAADSYLSLLFPNSDR